MITLGTIGYIAKDRDGTAYIYKDKPERDGYGRFQGEIICRIWDDDLIAPITHDTDPMPCEITININN